MHKKTLIALLLLAFALPAKAQFFLAGDDPARLHWYSVETPHYKLIYPEGADSLARSYGRAMEQFRVPMGRSLGGMTPGEGMRRKLPVVLHTHHVYSNGSVGWAPSRMDLYTHPEAYGADPTSWPTMPSSTTTLWSSAAALRAAFLPAVASRSLIRLSWLTSLAPGS